MKVDAHKNFAYSTVATAPSPAASGTSLVLAAGDGAKFPTPPFNATVWPVGSMPLVANAEIVRCTALSTDTLTIARAQESSAARTVIVGDQIAATITAKTLQDAENLVYDGDFSAGPTYQDGEIVVYNGIAYLCVQPTTNAPSAWPGGPTLAPPQMATYGTSLPSSPIDGQRHILVDSITNPSYQWEFRYNAGSTSAYKWEHVGGSPAFQGTNPATVITPGSTWINGPISFTIPRAGDYLFRFSCLFYNTTGTAADCVGGDDAAYPWLRVYVPAQVGVSQSGMTEYRRLGLTANLVLYPRLYSSVANVQASQLGWAITPIRVS